MIGGVHPGGVVDEVGIEPPAVQRVLDTSELGEAEIAAFAHHLATQRTAVDAQRVVGAVAALAVFLIAGFDVGADAAVPQQVHRCLEHRAHQLRGRELRGFDAERLLRLAGKLDGFGGAWKYAAAFGNQFGVVIRPRGARQMEHAFAFLEARLRVRRRIDEYVPMVEGGQQPDVRRAQHAVAKHVARHVADADHREVRGLRVHAYLAEVALDRLPGTARRYFYEPTLDILRGLGELYN